MLYNGVIIGKQQNCDLIYSVSINEEKRISFHAHY